jgi:hypothetical protein
LEEELKKHTVLRAENTSRTKHTASNQETTFFNPCAELLEETERLSNLRKSAGHGRDTCLEQPRQALR